jgi:hypothetical protein
MAFFGAIYWWSPETCLDDEFDVPDIAADRELCQAIVAGRWGPHPDAWGNHDPLTLMPPRFRDFEPEPAYVSPVSRKWKDDAKWQAEWEAKHRRPPVVVPPPSPDIPVVPPPPPPEIFTGEIELTCDECNRQFWLTLAYKSGERSTKAMHLLALGAEEGWTHIGGRDRCPECSLPAPKNVGNGTGKREGDKQYTNGG